MKTLNEIKEDKRFTTDKAFAKAIGITPGYMSLLMNGKARITEELIEKLQEKYPNDDFYELSPNNQIDEKDKTSLQVKNEHTAKPSNKVGMNRRIPLISIVDRPSLVAIEQSGYVGMENLYIPAVRLQNPRSEYFVLIAMHEPFVANLIRPGDHLLCHAVSPESWGVLYGVVLAYLKSGINQILYIMENNLWRFGPSAELVSDHTYSLDEIESIYQVESIIYRKL